MIKNIEFLKEEIEAEIRQSKVVHDESNIVKTEPLIGFKKNVIQCFNCDRPISSASSHSLCVYCSFNE